jgi:lysozyme
VKVLKGIDISNWQKDIDLSKINADFVIPKATEGVKYADPFMSGFLDKSIKLGKKVGVYHFARPEWNSSDSEARFFVDRAKNYIGKAVLALDWESDGKEDVAWAKRWLDTVYSLTGVRPIIYMSESATKQFNWNSVSKARLPTAEGFYHRLRPYGQPGRMPKTVVDGGNFSCLIG